MVTVRSLCLLIRNEEVLLGLKREERFGEGKYNGYGGKQEAGEIIERTAVRELYEETGIIGLEQDLEKVGVLNFTFPYKPSWDQIVHAYVLRRWEGDHQDTDEMYNHQWFPINNMPYDRMWAADIHWIPRVLADRN